MPAEVRVQYFAAARELCGVSEECVELTATPVSVRSFAALLGERHARLAPLLSRMRLAVNGELARDADLIADGDEVAVLPPVAGGAGAQVVLSGIRNQPLSVDEVLDAVRAPDAGGIALFIGTVRDHAEGKSVSRLDYEAHPELAARELDKLLDEIAAQRPGLRLAALHRTGELAIGELAVIVAASAAHREQAFVACREAIESIKQRVPIWKKEHWADGSTIWVNLETDAKPSAEEPDE